MLETTERAIETSAKNYASNETAEDIRATKNVGEKFIGALTELESARDVEQIVALFADDCEVNSVPASEHFRGIEGARQFWTQYRDAFKDVCSVFENENYSNDAAVLEWTTMGKIKNGNKIKYEALSILETRGEKITRFYAYFDPRNFGRQSTERENGSDGELSDC